MSAPTPRPRRGFLAAFQAAMAPVIPEDDGKPIVRPTAVTVGSVLVMLAGVVFLFTGGLLLGTKSDQLVTAQTQYGQAIAECKTYMGGIGSAVPSSAPTPTSASGPLAATALPSACGSVNSETLTADQLDSIGSSITLYGVVFAIIGLAVIAAGWFLRDAKKWARRVLVTVAVLVLAAAALLGISNAFTLVATLLLVVGLVCTFVGKGSMYFIRMAMRRAQQH